MDPSPELWIGIAGPGASVVSGGTCLTLAWALGWMSMAPAEPPVLARFVRFGYARLRGRSST
jgi:hypothetical protein